MIVSIGAGGSISGAVTTSGQGDLSGTVTSAGVLTLSLANASGTTTSFTGYAAFNASKQLVFGMTNGTNSATVTATLTPN
jgi:hypothetical protein